MKNLKPAEVSACLTFCSVCSIAQNIQNRSVKPRFTISGQVVSRADDQHSTSVVVKLTNRPGARLIFTKLTDPNNSVKFTGRIISLKHGDSYEIVSENDQCYLKKNGIYDLMTE